MEDIEDQTRRFAADLTSMVRAVCHDAPEFQVDIADRKGRFNAMVRTENGCAIPLTIGGVHLLDLLVTYQCIMSDHHACMAIEQSRFHLRPHGGGEMLVRLEYIRRPRSGIPCSHLQIHAHRDAWTFLMCRNGEGSGRRAVNRRSTVEKTPQISDIHFPVGGPRLRPTLEDFLEMLIHDLGIDHPDGALDALADARASWRRGQARAIIGADPETAAQVLRDAGWKVAPPEDRLPPERPPHWLARY